MQLIKLKNRKRSININKHPVVSVRNYRMLAIEYHGYLFCQIDSPVKTDISR